MNLHTKSQIALILSGLMLGMPAWAQDASDQQETKILEEVIVTAMVSRSTIEVAAEEEAAEALAEEAEAEGEGEGAEGAEDEAEGEADGDDGEG